MTNNEMLEEIRNEIKRRRKELETLENAAAILAKSDGTYTAQKARSNSRPKKLRGKSGKNSVETKLTAVKALVERERKSPIKQIAKKSGRKPGSAKKVKSKTGGKRVGNVNGKIVDGMKAAGKLMNNSEIAFGLAPYYPQKTKLQLNKYASILLNQLMNDKRVKRTLTDLNGKKLGSFYWGLPQWFDGDKPKAAYMR